jgi:hypothetical protein
MLSNTFCQSVATLANHEPDLADMVVVSWACCALVSTDFQHKLHGVLIAAD